MRLNIELDDETHRQFKSKCSAMGLSLADVTNQLVLTWLDGKREIRIEKKMVHSTGRGDGVLGEVLSKIDEMRIVSSKEDAKRKK